MVSAGDKFRLKMAMELAISETKERIRNLAEASAPVKPDVAIGRLSRMDAIGNKAINDKALEQARAELSRMEAGLTQLDSDDFGKCERCLQPIGIERLLAVPGVALCMRCAGRG